MEIVQNILVIVTVALALVFLYQKFFKKATKKSCGGDGCNC